MSGGCITRRWDETLEVNERVLDLLNDEPELEPKFQSLYRTHARKLPRWIRWGETRVTSLDLDVHRTAAILTTCSRRRGLHSTCWYASDTRSRRPR